MMKTRAGMRNDKAPGGAPHSKESALAENIIATVREPLLVMDADMKVVFANQAFFRVFQVTPEDTIGRLIYDLGNRQWNIPKLKKLLEEILPNINVLENYEVEHNFETIGPKTMLLNARRVDSAKMILLAIEDITERKRLQEELKESEERYRRAFETSRDGLLLIHKTKGDILNSNESIRELLGYFPEEFLKKKLWEIGVVKDDQDFQAAVGRLEKDGVIHYEDTPVKTKKGLSINTEVFLVNKAKVVQCNIRDITMRKQAEEALRASEEKFRALVETTSDWIWEVDSQWHYTYTCPRVKNILGYEPAEIIGKTFFDLMPAEEARRIGEIFKSLAANQQAIVALENVNLHKDGHQVVLETNGVPIFDEKGQLTGYRGIDRDITEHKRIAEDLLRVVQKELATLIESLPQKIFLKDKNSTYISCNKNYANDLKIKPADIVGKTDYDFFPKELADKYTADDKKIMTSGKAEEIVPET